MKKKGDKDSIKKEQQAFKPSTNQSKAEENRNTERCVFKDISNVVMLQPKQTVQLQAKEQYYGKTLAYNLQKLQVDNTMLSHSALSSYESNKSTSLFATSFQEQDQKLDSKSILYEMQRALDTKQNLKVFDPIQAKSMMFEMMKGEMKDGLIICPYSKKKNCFSSRERAKIWNILLTVQSGAVISDFAFLTALFIFDKVMEGIKLKSSGTEKMQYLDKQEFKIATVCLYLAAKYEDPKYPYFDSYRRLILEKVAVHQDYWLQVRSFTHGGFSMGEEVLDLELFVCKMLNFNLNVPVSFKFYERFARAAFINPDTYQQDFNLGLYFLFISSMYPKLQFEHQQSLIAASSINIVLRLRENDWFWSDYLHQEVTCGKYSEASLRQCTSRIIKKYVSLCLKRGKNYEDRLLLIEKKFAHKTYKEVSSIRPIHANQSRLNNQSSETKQSRF